jgi:ketosteroid isomerase-like protein
MIFKKVLMAVGFSLLFFMYGYGQVYEGKKKDIRKILENIASFSQFYMDAEYQQLADCYTHDGKIFPDKTGIIEGVDAIKKRWTLPSNLKIINHKIHPEEIRVIRKYAYDYGYYEGSTKNANGDISQWKGKYVIVWRKEKKEWKIYLDIWNRTE